MTKGICFFINYNNPIGLLVTALYTLKKYYKGNVTVMVGDQVPEFFVQNLKKDDFVSIKNITPESIYKNFQKHKQCWFYKPFIHLNENPYNINVMYDCDHLFIKNFDYNIFDLVEKNGLMTFHHESGIPRRSLKPILNDIKQNNLILKKVNGGCVGSVKNSDLIKEWINKQDDFTKMTDRVQKHADEYSLSYTLAKHNIKIGDNRWSFCVGRRDLKSEEKYNDNIISLHYYHFRYRLSTLYKQTLKEVIDQNVYNIKVDLEKYKQSNTLLANIINTL